MVHRNVICIQKYPRGGFRDGDIEIQIACVSEDCWVGLDMLCEVDFIERCDIKPRLIRERAR